MGDLMDRLRELPLDALRGRLVELAEEERIVRSVLSARKRLETQRERRLAWNARQSEREGERGGKGQNAD